MSLRHHVGWQNDRELGAQTADGQGNQSDLQQAGSNHGEIEVLVSNSDGGRMMRDRDRRRRGQLLCKCSCRASAERTATWPNQPYAAGYQRFVIVPRRALTG